MEGLYVVLPLTLGLLSDESCRRRWCMEQYYAGSAQSHLPHLLERWLPCPSLHPFRKDITLNRHSTPTVGAQYRWTGYV